MTKPDVEDVVELYLKELPSCKRIELRCKNHTTNEDNVLMRFQNGKYRLVGSVRCRGVVTDATNKEIVREYW